MSRSIAINEQRLLDSLDAYAQIGSTAGGGVTRLALSDEDKTARDQLAADLAAIDCPVVVDDFGNMTGTLAGGDNGPPVRIASHLDTVVRGGGFDGALGVLAGLEVLRTVRDLGLTPRRNLTLTNWTNEEGARFEPAMLGSGAALGVFEPGWTHERRDGRGCRFGDELSRIGYLGDARHRPLNAFAGLELHIEQGPVLDDADEPIGVVTGIVGITWIDVVVIGVSAHAGPTPMPLRRDAMVGAGEMIALAHAIGSQGGSPRASTVGRCEVEPNLINTIPGRVRLGIDFRAGSDAELDAMEAALREGAAAVANRHRLEIEIDRFWISSTVQFDPDVQSAIRRACSAVGYSARDVWSGAGHDSRYTADRYPTGMIFVRSRGGVSHTERELSGPEDVCLGANVLLRTALDLADA